MKFRRRLALLLVVAMAVVPLFVTSCAKKDDQGKGGQTELKDGWMPPVFDGTQKNFQNMEFNVLTKEDRSRTQAFNIIDLVGGEDNLGDSAINASVTERNLRIKDYYGVVIKRMTSANAYEELINAIAKLDDTYGASQQSISGGLGIALNGALVDMYNNVTYMDLEAPWWDSAIINDLLLYGGAYMALGDINTVDDDATWCVVFNKELYNQETHNEPKVLYDLVKSGDGANGGWTLEYLKALASSSFRADPNVQNKWEPDYAGQGTYGLMLQDEVATVLMQASGNTPTKLDDKSAIGIKDNIDGNAEFYNAIDKVYSLMGGTDKTQWLLNMNDVPTEAAPDIWETIARGGFKANRMMFYITHCGTINLIRDMESEFGVLPIPKVTEDQQKYGNTIQYGNATCYVIPSRQYKDPEADENAAYILEAMAYMSSSQYFEALGMKDTSLKFSYRETVLKRKATRDDESMEMLDMIFNNRVFDLALALNINGLNSIIQQNATSEKQSQFQSTYESLPDLKDALYKKLEVLLQK